MLNWLKAEYVIFPLLTLLFSLILTRLCIVVLPVIGYVDKPDARRIHKKIMPRGGGVAIFLSCLAGGIFYCWQHPSRELCMKMLNFFLPAAILFVTGLIDDRVGMNRFVKFALQIAAAVLAWFLGIRFTTLFGWNLPLALSVVVTVFWYLVFINGFNLIDGMDGAAAGLAVISSGCMAVWMLLQHNASDQTVHLLMMAGACLGFLRYNFYPARIFMGDTGSMFLGYFFAFCATTRVGKAATLSSLLVPMLAVGVPLFDVLLAFWRRLVRKLLHQPGAGIMSADLQHLHHRLLQQDKVERNKQRRVAFRLYFIALIFVVFGAFIQLTSQTIPRLSFFLVLALALLLVRRLAGIELYASTRLLRKGFSRPRRPLVMMTAIPVLDLGLLYGTIFFTLWYLQLPLPGDTQILLLLLGLPLLTALCGGYNIYWFRSGMEEIRKYLLIELVGVLLTAVAFRLSLPESPGSPARAFIGIYLLVGVFLLTAYRLLCIYIGTRFLWQLKQDAGRRFRQRTVLVGGGKNASVYINDRVSRISGIQLQGIVDDDPALNGMRVFGQSIIGTIDHLEAIYAKKPFDRLVITTPQIRRARLRMLFAFAAKHNVQVTRFVLLEREMKTPAAFAECDMQDVRAEKQKNPAIERNR